MFQYMIDYICSYKGIDSDVKNFVDKLKTFSIKINAINNFKNIIFFKFIRRHQQELLL